METSQKPLIAWEFPSGKWDKIYKAWVYDYWEDCNCKWFKRHLHCKHITELKEKLKKLYFKKK